MIHELRKIILSMFLTFLFSGFKELTATILPNQNTDSLHLLKKKISIYIDEYDFVFTPQNIACKETIKDTLGSNRQLIIKVQNCEGKMYVLCQTNDKKKIEEGEYIESLTLLRKYITSVNAITAKNTIRVYEYYQPLRHGTWLIYDKNGNLSERIKYSKGIVISQSGASL
jgi:hypothetical protein